MSRGEAQDDMVSTEQFYCIHEYLLAAAAGETPFSQFLQVTIGAFAGMGGTIFEFDRRHAAFNSWIGHGLETGQDEYRQHINAINPRMRYSLAHAAGHVAYDRKFIDERGMDRHEFYDWLNRHDGFRYFLGSRVLDEGDVSLFTSIEFSRSHAHPEAEEIAAFKRIAGSLGSAWRLAKRSGGPGPRTESWTQDHLPWAIFALARDGRVIEMNRRARTLLDRADALRLDDGVLGAIDRRSAGPFRSVVKQALAGETREALVRRNTGGPPLAVQVVPVNPLALASPSDVAAVVYVADPQRRGAGIGSRLARAYGFSPAEVRLAQALANGGPSLGEAADRLGISRNTARNQLQTMFAKSGTHRQTELLVQILCMLDDDPPAGNGGG